MFDPKNLSKLKEEYNSIIDISAMKIDSTESTDIYEIYFLSQKKVIDLKSFQIKNQEHLSTLKPFLTHKNKDLRDLVYKCYQSLQGIEEKIPSDIENMNKLKIQAVEKFHINFEKNEGV